MVLLESIAMNELSVINDRVFFHGKWITYPFLPTKDILLCISLEDCQDLKFNAEETNFLIENTQSIIDYVENLGYIVFNQSTYPSFNFKTPSTEDTEEDSDEEDLSLRDKKYSPNECVFWVQKYGSQNVLHISTRKLNEDGDDDNFGSHNFKDLNSLPEFLHTESSAMTWEIPEDKEDSNLIDEMKSLGFEYAPDLND